MELAGLHAQLRCTTARQQPHKRPRGCHLTCCISPLLTACCICSNASGTLRRCFSWLPAAANCCCNSMLLRTVERLCDFGDETTNTRRTSANNCRRRMWCYKQQEHEKRARPVREALLHKAAATPTDSHGTFATDALQRQSSPISRQTGKCLPTLIAELQLAALKKLHSLLEPCTL